MLKKPIFALTVATLSALLGSVAGVAAVSTVQVSGPSPTAACATQDAGQPGRNYLNAEVEPQIAVHGQNIIGMFHQDRWSNGGAHGIGVSVSTDGGSSWSESAWPADMCAPGTPSSLNFYARNSDPWVSFGPDGTAYASALSFNVNNNFNAVAAGVWRKSTGWTDMQPIPGSVFTLTQQGTDKNATTADPVKVGYAYTVWDTLILPTDNPRDFPHTSSYTGPAYFSKTNDGGKTWSDARVIIGTNTRQQTIGNIIVVDPRNGTLYDFTDLIVPPNTPRQGVRSNAELAFVKSTDGGDTWTQPQVIAPFNSLGVQDPNTGEPLRVGDGLEEVAIDPANGNLYAVWESSSSYQKQLKQSRAAFDDQVSFTRSTDGGGTWSAPAVIHTAGGMPTFTPTVAVNGGRLAVTYYDSRYLQPGQTANMPTDYWVEFSNDGGATWGGEERITATSFDVRTAPVARGFFLGDYEGLQPDGSGFRAIFVKTNCNSTDPGGQVFPSGGPCAAASSNVAPTANMDPTDVFVSSLS